MSDQRTATSIDTPRERGLRGRLRRAPIALALATAALSAAAAGDVVAAPAPPAEPCAGAGARTVTCPAFPKGAPVQGPKGRIIGTLPAGAHAVYCQRAGVAIRSGGRRSNNWAITRAGAKWGWVNAVYTSGTSRKPRFKLVPRCPARFAPPSVPARNAGNSNAPGNRDAGEAPADPDAQAEPGAQADPGGGSADPAAPDPAQPDPGEPAPEPEAT